MRSLAKQVPIMIVTAAFVAASLLALTSTDGRPRTDLSNPDWQATQPSALTESTGVKKAPDFGMTDIRGQKVSLTSLRGKVVIVDFWATWCPPCRVEIPILNELRETYRQQGLEVIGISLDQSVDEIKAFMQQVPIKYPVVHGDDTIVSQFGGIVALPTVFILDRKGNIRHQHIGLTSKSTFEQEIRRLLAE